MISQEQCDGIISDFVVLYGIDVVHCLQYLCVICSCDRANPFLHLWASERISHRADCTHDFVWRQNYEKRFNRIGTDRNAHSALAGLRNDSSYHLLCSKAHTAENGDHPVFHFELWRIFSDG